MSTTTTAPPTPPPKTTINDLPDAILTSIISTITDTRSRNSTSLVSKKLLTIERATRTSLTLRGNIRDLFLLPNCFHSITHLDISLLSPWGRTPDPLLLSHLLPTNFPSVTSLTLYARTPSTLQSLAPRWPRLSHVKLVRWHQRSPTPPGSDFIPLFSNSHSLTSLSLSQFYCWTEDLPPALAAYPNVATNLSHLDLLNLSFVEGFKAQEIHSISVSCPNLTKFLAACMFDPRYIDFIGDEALIDLATNCPKLSLLHLADTLSLSMARGDPEHEGYSTEDARISCVGLVQVFTALPLLEELALDVCNNVGDSGVALEVLNSKCPRLRSLRLGHFHGLCLAIDSTLDGIALCSGLESLSIKNSADLTDMGLIAIAKGCSKLAKFEVQGCKKITVHGFRTLAWILHRTLVDVKISCCKNLDAAMSLHALDRVRDRITRLHIDCVWNPNQGIHDFKDDFKDSRKNKKIKYSSEPFDFHSLTNGYYNNDDIKTWNRLQQLSLWISVGDPLMPLAMTGLEDCPNLEEIQIRVEGDCRERPMPSHNAFGLISLNRYPRLSKMQLDCRDTIGFALTAPSGHMDLSLWERFFLNGIGHLMLNELDYWPPQDRDVNQRGLSLPGAGLLAECPVLRKLFIHGTAHEHFMMFLPRIPTLRDVQLREDYYPAPENDTCTEMRVDSCSRFEDALNRRPIPD